MSRKGQVGKQVRRRKYRRVRFDLIAIGVLLIAAGILAYYIAGTLSTGSQGGLTAELDPREALRGFLDIGTLRNETLVLVYRVRGDVPASGYVLGTLDYLYLTIRKEFSRGNESEVYVVSYSAFPFAVQPQLYLVPEVLGIAFKAESLGEIFFNPTITSLWGNLTIENFGSSTTDNRAFGRVAVAIYRYTYTRTIDEVPRNISVVVCRGSEVGLIPIKAEVRVDGSSFTVELVSVQKLG